MSPEEVAEKIIPRGQYLLPEDANDYRAAIADAIREAVAAHRSRSAATANTLAAEWPRIAFELPQATAANFHAITGQMVADAVAAQFQDPPLGRSVKAESAR